MATVTPEPFPYTVGMSVFIAQSHRSPGAEIVTAVGRKIVQTNQGTIIQLEDNSIREKGYGIQGYAYIDENHYKHVMALEKERHELRLKLHSVANYATLDQLRAIDKIMNPPEIDSAIQPDDPV